MMMAVQILFMVVTFISVLGAIGSKEKEEATRMTALSLAGMFALLFSFYL